MGWCKKGRRKKKEKEKLAKDRTKVIRLFESEYVRIKNGSYEKLINLIYEYKSQLENNKKAKRSPRWSKISQFLKEAEEIFGSDYQFWIEDD